ncbi:UDP-N-acetylglucosamine 2-epimerase [compost metagenome]
MKVAVIFGTRPEGIKMAPLVKALKKDKDINCVFINTAQHREMLDQVLEMFNVTSDYDLNIMKSGQSLEELTSRMIPEVSKILDIELPDLILVQGDTTSTFVGAYCGFLKKIPVGHVEAGLRTYNLYSPFPEEGNRQMVSRIASYHFGATEKNRQNLLQEKINSELIYVVGNTVIDALFEVIDDDFNFEKELSSILSNGKKTILLTTHRRENLEQLKNVYEAINKLLCIHKDIQIIFPVHKNPAVRQQVEKHLNISERVHLIEPAEYSVFANLLKKSYLIITDSGGVQEEAPALGIPVLVTRDTTERPEGVEVGTLKLVGTDTECIFNEADELLTNKESYNKMSIAKNPYGDGTSSKQIIEIIKDKLKKTH